MASDDRPATYGDLKGRQLSEDADSNDPVSEAARGRPKGQSGYANSTLNVPARSSSPDTLSLLSADDFTELQLYDTRRTPANRAAPDTFDEKHVPTWKSSFERSWIHNKGVVFVLFAQIFSTMMAVSTRILEQDSGDVKAIDPLNILFIRMAITTVICVGYCWYASVEHFPLGAREVRWQLVARGCGGFCGVIGFYYSLMWLSLSDAVTLSFLAPSLICYACSKILNEPFTPAEKIGGLISLCGVVLIARPSFIFSAFAGNSGAEHTMPTNTTMPAAHAEATTKLPHAMPASQPHVRLMGIGMAMLSVAGTTIAFTSIRWIGHRAHPLISTNYFTVVCMAFSAIALAAIPKLSFEVPNTGWQWGLLIFIGICGFLNQFLMTAGLRYAKDSRATNMTFSSMVFAMISDKVVWGHTPSGLSLVGSALIVGSAVIVALQKGAKKGPESPGTGDLEAGRGDDGAARPLASSERGTTEEQAGLLHESVELQERGAAHTHHDDESDAHDSEEREA